MLEEVYQWRLKCSLCGRVQLLLTEGGATGAPDVPNTWSTESSDHICPHCRALRGDFGKEAQRNVNMMLYKRRDTLPSPKPNEPNETEETE